MSDLPAGNGPAMAGNNESTAADAAAVAACVPSALADAAANQSSARQFIAEHGAQVVAGHPGLVEGTAGEAGDYDSGSPA
jgi:hypothetical protein